METSVPTLPFSANVMSEASHMRLLNVTYEKRLTPLFGEEAILSFNALEKDHYMELSFTVNGAEMEYGYSRKAMVEINPGIDEDLDIVEIVLTVDEYGTPKNMSTKLSMTRLKNEGDVLAKKTIDMDYVFNAFDNISLQAALRWHHKDIPLYQANRLYIWYKYPYR